MSNNKNENIVLTDIKLGTKVIIVNRTDSAKRYTFKNGGFGTISFVLIVGAECEFIVGSEVPVIVMDDAEVIDGENVTIISA